MDGKKALIGMSGGVDSSVAALLMLRAGYECIGATMRLYDNDMIGLEKGHTCCSLDDVEDARSVARRLGIPHYVFNFKDDFERQVIRKFVSCYECGGTPNPCIDCNRYLKFDRLPRSQSSANSPPRLRRGVRASAALWSWGATAWYPGITRK